MNTPLREGIFIRSPWILPFHGEGDGGFRTEFLLSELTRIQPGLRYVTSPRHADVLLILGAVREDLSGPLGLIFSQMSRPRAAVLVLDRCVLSDSGSLGGLPAETISVDASPEAVWRGIREALCGRRAKT